MPKKKEDESLQITEWLSWGLRPDDHLSDCGYVKDVQEIAGRILDKHVSGEIVGPVLFRAADGRHYTGSVEFVIYEASAELVESRRIEMEEEGDSPIQVNPTAV